MERKMNPIEILKEHESEINRMYHVSRIGVFGSFARGEERDESDVDILVEFKPGFKTFDNYMDLKFHLEDLLSRKVDLVTVNALKPQLKNSILQDVIYA
jgi:predicted nucleotidyltransferase